LALALAFASCGGSESTEETAPTGGTGETETTPSTPTVTVVALNIITQPTATSFQGDRVNLGGIVAEAYFSDNPTVAKILSASDLYTVPEFCDAASTTTANSTIGSGSKVSGYGLAVRGYTGVTNQQLVLPYVQPIDGFNIVSGPKVTDWYSDERPNIDGLTYDIVVHSGWYNNTATAVQGEYTKRISADPTYPKITLPAAGSKNITLTIDAAASTPKTATYALSNYYRATGIGVVPNSFDSDKAAIFDDDVGTFYNAGAYGTATLKSSDIISTLKTAGVEFEVVYDKNAKLKKITVDEFNRNNSWYKENNPTAPSTSYAANGVAGTDAFDVQIDNTDVRVFRYDPDEEDWGIQLQYAPILSSADATASSFDVRIPIWVFDSLNDQAQKRWQGANASNPDSNEPVITDAPTARTLTGTELAAIDNRWYLVGNYTSGSKPAKTKNISVTASMIYLGYTGAVSKTQNGSRAVAGWASIADGSLTPSLNIVIGVSNPGWNNTMSNGIASGGLARGYQLPIYYRKGAYLTGEDSVTVTVKATQN